MDAQQPPLRVKSTGNGASLIYLTSKSKPCNNSVLALRAQNGEVLEPVTENEKLISVISSIIAVDNSSPVFLKAIIELMFLNGLRISEVLSIKGCDISRTGHIRVKLSKTTGYRMCVSSIYRSFWLRFIGSNYYIFADYSRFFFYREFKKLGLTMQFNNSVYNAVTHSFRHLLFSSAYSGTHDIATLQNFVNHKHVKSSLHYATKKHKT